MTLKQTVESLLKAREMATAGEWYYENGPTRKSAYHCAFAGEVMALESHEGTEQEQAANVKLAILAANHTEAICKSWLEMRDALEAAEEALYLIWIRNEGHEEDNHLIFELAHDGHKSAKSVLAKIESMVSK